MDQLSLWGDEFTVKQEDLNKILKKAKTPKNIDSLSTDKKLASKYVSIYDKMQLIKDDVYQKLGHFANDTKVIRTYEDYKKYIDKCIENGIVAIDTETNNTIDVFGDCHLMGLCLYTPGQKQVYIPVNHRHFTAEYDEKGIEQIIIGERLEGQLNEEQIASQLSRLTDTFNIFHNAIFDMEVLQQTTGVRVHADWDTQVGAQMIDENELKGLKAQYRLHIDPSQEKYDIEHLFQGFSYAIFDPELFALYAATDSGITYKLYLWQKEQLEQDDLKDVYKLFKEIEMPILDVVVDMETRGISINKEYASKMSAIYHKKSDEVQEKIDAELVHIQPMIDDWKLTPEANTRQKVYLGKKSKLTEDKIQAQYPYVDEKGKRYKYASKTPVEQLSNPIDLGSGTQLAILLYDIMKVPVLKSDEPRGTGKDILDQLADEEHIKLCELIKEKRAVDILIDTFIDAIPDAAKDDGRVHAKFRTVQTKTSRFSSDTPNLQNIPSHDKTVRMIFRPTDGYAIIGGDYSGQEPRSLCAFAQDKDMQYAYEHKQDLYSAIAAKCYHNNYEDNLEFQPQPDGTVIQSQEGKERRSHAKQAFLGINYGMSAPTLAKRMNLSLEEAQTIIDAYYEGFKGVYKFTQDSQKMAKEKGYVDNMFGYRRHLPDATLPPFTVAPKTKQNNFNPLIGAKPHEDKLLNAKIKSYETKLSKAKKKFERDAIIKQAEADGLFVRNNGAFISRALRQTLNARIQGTAASMTKLAMIMINNDPELINLDAHLLATIHDEVFLEAPIKNRERVAERLCELMVTAANVKCSFTPWSVDPYIVRDGWYEDENISKIHETYEKLTTKKGKSADEALKITQDQFSMYNPDSIKLICDQEYEIFRDSLIYGPNYFEGK